MCREIAKIEARYSGPVWLSILVRCPHDLLSVWQQRRKNRCTVRRPVGQRLQRNPEIPDWIALEFDAIRTKDFSVLSDWLEERGKKRITRPGKMTWGDFWRKSHRLILHDGMKMPNRL